VLFLCPDFIPVPMIYSFKWYVNWNFGADNKSAIRDNGIVAFTENHLQSSFIDFGMLNL
jgi:hypothetical protein